MQSAQKSGEPSMDDILASIRKIISDDPGTAAAAVSKTLPIPAAPPEPVLPLPPKPAGAGKTAPRLPLPNLDQELSDLLSDPVDVPPAARPVTLPPTLSSGAPAAPLPEKSGGIGSWFRGKPAAPHSEANAGPANAPFPALSAKPLPAPAVLPEPQAAPAATEPLPPTPVSAAPSLPLPTSAVAAPPLASPPVAPREARVPSARIPAGLSGPQPLDPAQQMQSILGRLAQGAPPVSAPLPAPLAKTRPPEPTNFAQDKPVEATFAEIEVPATSEADANPPAAESSGPSKPVEAAATSPWTETVAVAPAEPERPSATVAVPPVEAPVLPVVASAPVAGPALAVSKPETSAASVGMATVPVPETPPAAAATAASTAPRTLEDMLADLMRPMVRQWLDDNMLRALEKALREEVAAKNLDKPKG